MGKMLIKLTLEEITDEEYESIKNIPVRDGTHRLFINPGVSEVCGIKAIDMVFMDLKRLVWVRAAQLEAHAQARDN